MRVVPDAGCGKWNHRLQSLAVAGDDRQITHDSEFRWYESVYILKFWASKP